MSTLFEIGSELTAMLDSIKDDGEIDAEFDAWMSRLAEQEADKLDNYVGAIRTLEMEASAAKDIAQRFFAKQRSRESKIAFMKKRMKEHLEKTNRKRIETTSGWVIRLHANKQGFRITGEVPTNFTITETKTTTNPNWKMIEDALKKGELAFAKMDERTSHLRIE